MNKMYFVTITGLDYYYGKTPFEIGRIIRLVKEPENVYDNEAIAAWLPYVEKIGYVANSTKTVYNGTISAGRLYDKIEDYAYAKVMFVTHTSAIALVLDKDDVEEISENNGDIETEKSNSVKTKLKRPKKQAIGFKA